jgi:MFS family permease
MADMYGKSHRGRSIALATFLPYLGPALGPIVGGLATGYVSWHWLFWILSFLDAIVVLLGILTIKESYTPVLLKRKAAKNVDRKKNDEKHSSPNHRVFWSQLAAQFAGNLKRPALLLVKQPAVQLIALVMALNFGTYVLMISTTALMWLNRYHQSATDSSTSRWPCNGLVIQEAMQTLCITRPGSS